MKYKIIRQMILVTMVCIGISACGTKKEDTTQNVEQAEIVNEDETDVQEDEDVSEDIQDEIEPFEKFTGYTTTIVNVRKDPSSDSDSFGTIKYNAKLTIIGEDGEWYEVKVGDETGYISKSFISTEEMPEIINEENDDKNEDNTNVDGINNENENNEENKEEINTEDTSTATEQTSTETNTSKPEAGNVVSGDAYQQEVLNQINEYRKSNGLGTLVLTDKLCASAATRASEIAYTGSHSRPDGSKWITSLTFSPKTAIAENGGHVLPEHSIVEAWKGSSSHNAQLLNSSYTVCGIGYYTTDDGGKYVALHLY